MTQTAADKPYAVAGITNDVGRQQVARVAIDRSWDPLPVSAYFSGPGKGPEDWWTHHKLTWDFEPGSNELQEDVQPDLLLRLRLKLKDPKNPTGPAASTELIAALSETLSSWHISLLGEVDVPDGATALSLLP